MTEKHVHEEKHKVELFAWVHNLIKKTEYFFEELAGALHFAKHVDAHDVKVYNHKGEMVHGKNKGGEDSYA